MRLLAPRLKTDLKDILPNLFFIGVPARTSPARFAGKTGQTYGQVDCRQKENDTVRHGMGRFVLNLQLVTFGRVQYIKDTCSCIIIIKRRLFFVSLKNLFQDCAD